MISYLSVREGKSKRCTAYFAHFRSMSELQFKVSVCAQSALDLTTVAIAQWPTYLRTDVREAAAQLKNAFEAAAP